MRVKMNRMDSALYCLRKGIASDQLYVKANACQLVSQLFEGMGQLDSAYYYSEFFSCLRDSLDRQMHSTDMAETRNAYWHSHVQEENIASLREQSWKASRRNVLLAGTIFLLLAAFAVVYFVREQKRRCLRQMLIQEQEKSRRIQVEQEKKEVELREGFYKRLNRLYWPSLGTSHVKLMQDDWNQLIQNTDAVFNGFTVRLRQSYPSMTDSDICFCCLVKMQLEIRVMADVLGLSKDAVYKRKDRLRKDKMGLLPGQHLDDILRDF